MSSFNCCSFVTESRSGLNIFFAPNRNILGLKITEKKFFSSILIWTTGGQSSNQFVPSDQTWIKSCLVTGWHADGLIYCLFVFLSVCFLSVCLFCDLHRQRIIKCPLLNISCRSLYKVIFVFFTKYRKKHFFLWTMNKLYGVRLFDNSQITIQSTGNFSPRNVELGPWKINCSGSMLKFKKKFR